MDYLHSNDAAGLDKDAILKIRAKRFDPTSINDYVSLPNFKTRHLKFDQGTVEIGHREELTNQQHTQLLTHLRKLIPWKKGPFNFFGHAIDAEWRSDMKWNRILPELSPLRDKAVADIGCHNGYFMFRMADQKPRLVVGFEPYMKHWATFQMFQRYAQCPNLFLELLGIQHFDFYPNFFDTVFCLGVIYHHTDPIGLLRKIHQAMKPGGEIIMESQGIPGEGPLALTPQNRYAHARGIYHLPTQNCLENWMLRAGFHQIKTFNNEPLTSAEQRATSWAPVKSLKDFLDPQDPSKTIEGYPAPQRIYVKAQRG